jgi:hypothetical protein
LKADGVVLWAHGVPLQYVIPPAFHYIGHPVIWNILDEEKDETLPFTNNLFHITVLTKGNPLFPDPSPTSVVSSSVSKGYDLPLAVLEFLLKTVSISGDSVLMPCGGPVDFIATLGRRPIVCTKEKDSYDAYVKRLTEYYSLIYQGKVEFK